VALLKDAAERERAKQFLDHLNSEEAGAIFKAYGFTVLPTEKGL